jgi:hypothetical protein
VGKYSIQRDDVFKKWKASLEVKHTNSLSFPSLILLFFRFTFLSSSTTTSFSRLLLFHSRTPLLNSNSILRSTHSREYCTVHSSDFYSKDFFWTLQKSVRISSLPFVRAIGETGDPQIMLQFLFFSRDKPLLFLLLLAKPVCDSHRISHINNTALSFLSFFCGGWLVPVALNYGHKISFAFAIIENTLRWLLFHSLLSSRHTK